MAVEINYRHTATGHTLYFIDESAAGLVWNGTTDAAFAVANWATYAQTMTETPASSYRYVGTKPATAAGKRRITIFRRIGATAAITDTKLASGEIGWTGSAECSLLNYLSDSIVNFRHTATGATLYGTFELIPGGTVWNGSALETMVVANWGTYDVALTENPASSYRYLANIPALSTGRYKVTIFKQLAAAPAVNDEVLAVGEVVVFSTGTPVREQIVDAIEDRMQAILTTSGYRTNLGQHVYRWKDRPFLPAELPGVDIRDGAEDTGYIAVGEHLHRLSIELRTTATTEAAVRLGIADVVTAVGQDVTWGGLAEDTSIEADGTIDVDGQGADTVYGSKVRLVVEYATAPFTP